MYRVSIDEISMNPKLYLLYCHACRISGSIIYEKYLAAYPYLTHCELTSDD